MFVLKFEPSQTDVWLVVHKVTMGLGSLPVLLFCPVSIIPPMLHTHLHLHVALSRETNGRSLRVFQKNNALSEIGELCIEKYFALLLSAKGEHGWPRAFRGTPCYVRCVGAWHQFAQFVCRWFYQWHETCESHVMVRNSASLLEYPVDAVELNGPCASCCTDAKNTEWLEMLTLVSPSGGWLWSTDMLIRLTLEQDMEIAARKDMLQAAALLVVPQSAWLPCQCLEITKPLEWDLVSVNILGYSL